MQRLTSSWEVLAQMVANGRVSLFNNSCRKSSLRTSYQRYLPAQCSMKTGYPLCHVRRQFHPSIVSRMRDMGIVSMTWSHAVTRKEMISNPKAMEAFMKEWKGL